MFIRIATSKMKEVHTTERVIRNWIDENEECMKSLWLRRDGFSVRLMARTKEPPVSLLLPLDSCFDVRILRIDYAHLSAHWRKMIQCIWHPTSNNDGIFRGILIGQPSTINLFYGVDVGEMKFVYGQGIFQLPADLQSIPPLCFCGILPSCTTSPGYIFVKSVCLCQKSRTIVSNNEYLGCQYAVPNANLVMRENGLSIKKKTSALQRPCRLYDNLVDPGKHSKYKSVNSMDMHNDGVVGKTISKAQSVQSIFYLPVAVVTHFHEETDTCLAYLVDFGLPIVCNIKNLYSRKEQPAVIRETSSAAFKCRVNRVLRQGSAEHECLVHFSRSVHLRSEVTLTSIELDILKISEKIDNITNAKLASLHMAIKKCGHCGRMSSLHQCCQNSQNPSTPMIESIQIQQFHEIVSSTSGVLEIGVLMTRKDLILKGIRQNGISTIRNRNNLRKFRAHRIMGSSQLPLEYAGRTQNQYDKFGYKQLNGNKLKIKRTNFHMQMGKCPSKNSANMVMKYQHDEYREDGPFTNKTSVTANLLEKKIALDMNEPVTSFIRLRKHAPIYQIQRDDLLDVLEEQLDSLQPTSLISEEELQVGTLCVSFCRTFDSMFRAVITNINNIGIEVHYVVYGNYETVNRDDLMSISNLSDVARTYPGMAIPCMLFNSLVSSTVSNSAETKDEFITNLKDAVSYCGANLPETEVEVPPSFLYICEVFSIKERKIEFVIFGFLMPRFVANYVACTFILCMFGNFAK
uniref:Bm12806 n=1 Tax=Brugia malayi TaxID=6279 RepID=A0A0I9N7T6_BRUMA|nr:Bm12806 [Brugia malayi]